VLYQNDGFGKDLLSGFTEGIKGSGISIVAQESYEATDPTVAPQVKKLAASKADTFLDITTRRPARRRSPRSRRPAGSRCTSSTRSPPPRRRC
jgi:branched-chain amino acid transport system substrate-binding protein